MLRSRDPLGHWLAVIGLSVGIGLVATAVAAAIIRRSSAPPP